MLQEEDGVIVQEVGPELWFLIRRSTMVADTLVLNDTKKWFDALPMTVQPVLTAETFPRIVNALAECWPDAPRCRAYFANLLTDLRGGRQGFPPLVRLELESLLAHFEKEVDRAIARELKALRKQAREPKQATAR